MYSSRTPILVVDKQDTQRQLLVSTLKAMGFKNIKTADNTTSAWSMLKQQVGIEVVISDWEGAEGTGLDLVLKIRDDENLKGLGYIMTSTEGEHGQVLLAIKSGVDVYIKKPFAAKTIEEKLAELFKKRHRS